MTVSNYSDCKALSETRKRKLANNTYLQEMNPEDGSFSIRLHNTNIIRFYPDGRVELNSGGWQTVTTKQRMQAFTSLRLWSDKGVWFVSDSGFDNGVPFADGITFHADGSVTGEGEDPKAQQKERKKADTFARRYVEAMANGKVPTPSSADCFGCSMATDEGERPMGGREHILSHIEEDYFVPSIAILAANRFGMPVAGRRWIGACYAMGDGKPAEEVADRHWGGIVSDQVRKAIKRWALAELGHAV